MQASGWRPPRVRRLAGGLTVGLVPRRQAPVVSTVVCYRAGTAAERPGLAGLAHFVEHMMFKGSPGYGPGEVDRVTQSRGGFNNAYTGHDATLYQFSFAADRWQAALAIEADRMAGLLLEPRQIEAEREVILEELGMVADDPWDALELELLACFYGGHPYGRPVLGRRATLERIGRAELDAFHRRHYRPDNAVLVIAGDVGDEAFAAAERSFGRLAAVSGQPVAPAAALGGRPAPPAGRRVELRRGELARLLVALPAPPAGETGYAALRVVLTVLAGGRSSRLNRLLVEERRLCSSVGAQIDETIGPGVALLACELLPEASPEEVEELLLAELARLAGEGLGAAESARARRQLVADWVFSRETVAQEALAAATALALFDAEHERRHVERVERCTAGELDAAAAAHLAVRGPGDRLVAAGRGGRLMGGDGRLRPTAATETARIRCRRVDGPPVAAVRVCLPGGSRAETVPGTALICGRALVEGSRRRDWRQVFEAAEDRGVELDGMAGFEATGLAIDCLASELDRALDWAAELVLEPAFAPDRIAWLTRQAAAELAALADQPAALTGQAFLEQLYDPSPRGRPLQGTPGSLERIGAAECRAFHRRALARGPIVAVSGDIDETRVRRRVEELFAAAARRAEAPSPPPPVGTGERRRAVAVGRVDQAHLIAGHLTVGRDHPDLPALEVLSVILGSGAGLAGRIPERVRERDGLAYVAGAEAAAGAGLEPGRLEVYLATSPGRLAAAERAVREELALLLDEGPTDAEVLSARDYLLASEPFRFETARQWSDLLVDAELFGLPLDDPGWRLDRWRRLARPEVAAAARRHLSVDELRVALGVPDGSPDAAGSGLAEEDS